MKNSYLIFCNITCFIILCCDICTSNAAQLDITHTFDNINRVTATAYDQTGSFITTTYTYDKLGNILSEATSADSDIDEDGLPDSLEATMCTDSTTADSDLDTISDYDEYVGGITDPCLADTDSDGLMDNEDTENCLDPRNPDSDGDGLLDGIEVNTYQSDPCAKDSDGDGMHDGAEIDYYNSCLDPTDQDTDDDGLTDYEEIFETITDPCNVDTDGDQVQDGTELGLTLADIGPDTDPSVFEPDLDSSTTTDPRDRTDNNYTPIYISGTVSVPDGPVTESLQLNVTAWAPVSGERFRGSSLVTISAGQTSVTYSIEIADDAPDLEKIAITASPYGDENYVEASYYVDGSIWERHLASVVDATDGEEYVDITLLEGVSVGGTISLPNGETAAQSFDIYLKILHYDENTYTSYTTLGKNIQIEEGSGSTSYEMKIAASATDFILGYQMYHEIAPHYARSAFYTDSGMVSTITNALKLKSAEDNSHRNITLLGSKMLSGTVSLPAGYTPSEDLWFGVVIKQLDFDDYGGWQVNFITDNWFTFPKDQTDIPYEMIVPEDVGSYVVSYYFETAPDGLVKEMYYSTSGMTVDADQATQLLANQNNSEIDLILQTAKMLNGTISLPAGYAPTVDLFFGVVIKQMEFDVYRGWQTTFITDHWVTFPKDQVSIPYEMIIPNGIGNFVVSYYFSTAPDGLTKEMYYLTDGMTYTASLATQLSADISHPDIDLVLQQPGGSISGTIELPDELMTEADINIQLTAIDTENNYLPSSHYTIQAGSNSVTFEYSLPAKSIEYRFQYFLMEELAGYMRTTFYTNSGYASYMNASVLNSDNAYPDITLELWPSITITGSVFFPGNTQAPADMYVNVGFYNDIGNTWVGGRTVFFPSTSFEMSYSAEAPKDSGQLIAKYKRAFRDDLTPNGFQLEGYHNGESTRSFQSQATLLETTDNQVNINLTLLPRPQPGDYNIDGEVNLVDAVIALKAIIGQTVELNPVAHVDASGDDTVGLADAIHLLNQLSE